MIRDSHKNKEYFDTFIDKKVELINKNLNNYKNDLIKEDRIESVMNFTIGRYKKLFEARYSRGDHMFSKEVYNEFTISMTLLNENWKKNSGKFIYNKRIKPIVLQQYTFSMYLSVMDRLAIAILLNVEATEFNQLFKFIDTDNIKDFLLEFLMRYHNPNRPAILEESYKEFFHINERLGRLKSIIKEKDKAIAEQELKFFLENEWYASFKGTPLYNQHLNPHNTYAGYWCFTAAAIVKIKGLDDRSFRDHPYYPKDMLL